MITAVHVAGVLERELQAARLGVHAHSAGLTVEAGQRGVEHLDVDGADVAAHPLLEHVDQEPAVHRWPDRPAGDHVPVLGVERAVSCPVTALVADVVAGPVAGPVAPACVRKRELLLGDPLDDGDELDERGSELVAQESVDAGAVVAVYRVDRGEDVPVDVVPLEDVQAADDPLIGGLAALVDPVGVVQRPRAVDRDPDEEVVLAKESTPVVVEERAVGLDRVEYSLARPGVSALELDRAAEEVEPHHGRLAALPGHDHLGRPLVCGKQLADVALLQVRRHPEPAAWVEHLLGEEEAVLTVQVADRAGRLRHQVKRQGSPWHGGQDRVVRSGRVRAGHVVECRRRAGLARVGVNPAGRNDRGTSRGPAGSRSEARLAPRRGASRPG